MSRSLASIWRATVGFDAIGTGLHPSFAQALETSMVCEIPSKPLTIFPEKCPICVSR